MSFIPSLKKYAVYCAIVSFSIAAITYQSAYAQNQQSASPSLEDRITTAWHTGKTLPVEVGKKFPPNQINVKNDKGFNVLIDISHECSFASLWKLGGRLHQMGFRSVSNQASLNTVLDPKGKCRIRVPFDSKEKIFPFAWYPNFKYNVVITEQTDPNGQQYTNVEQKSLVNFVKNGGGLIIMGKHINNQSELESWSLNTLAKRFGGELTQEKDSFENKNYAVLKLDKNWEVIASGNNNKPVQAKRKFGKGKVVLMGSVDAIRGRESNEFVNSLLDWVCAGQKPVGGEPRFPQPMGGGGAIYPELESIAGDIVVYYAANQKEHLLNTINQTFPEATKKVLSWHPSLPTKEPMTLILSAGNGGGWAVNAFKPKENGVISSSSSSLISIYGHELAHTLAGPPSDNGLLAGNPPIAEKGEAHAGWFQGKIDAWFDESRRDKPNRNCGQALNDPKIVELDMKRFSSDREYAKQFGNSRKWTKTWYAWQKLDDRYGPTWYPRWKWIQHTRWAHDPNKKLSWEEMVEDMSIAVGEDLFPFFRKINTSLNREVAGKLDFMGKSYDLPESPLDATPPGPVRLDDIGDYKKPITVK